MDRFEVVTVVEDRIDVSVRRLLLEKFRLGLFDQRYVDVDAGLDAQRASYTLLTNSDDILPLNSGLVM